MRRDFAASRSGLGVRLVLLQPEGGNDVPVAVRKSGKSPGRQARAFFMSYGPLVGGGLLFLPLQSGGDPGAVRTRLSRLC